MADELLTFKRELEERTANFAVESDELVRIFQTIRTKMFQKRKAVEP